MPGELSGRAGALRWTWHHESAYPAPNLAIPCAGNLLASEKRAFQAFPDFRADRCELSGDATVRRLLRVRGLWTQAPQGVPVIPPCRITMGGSFRPCAHAISRFILQLSWSPLRRRRLPAYPRKARGSTTLRIRPRR